MMSETPIFDQLAAVHLSRSASLVDAIVAEGGRQIVTGLEVLLTWAAGESDE